MLSQKAQTIHLEAEDGERVGTSILTEGAGFSGTGYVGKFEAQGTSVKFAKVRATAGIYEARVRYRCASEKGVELVVNGCHGTFRS